MNAFQLVRNVLGNNARLAAAAAPRGAARAYVQRAQACAPAARRFYSTEKGKEKEDAPNGDAQKEQPTAGDAAAAPKPEDDIQAKLQVKQDEVMELTSRLRYAQADFINLQRISAREKEQTRDFAISKFAGDLLETADTLAMALRAAQQRGQAPAQSLDPAYFDSSSPRADPLVQGVEATQRILLQTLAKYGIKPYDPTGETFDPNRHEALYSAPIPGKKPGEILECQKIGYMIKDRVLRAAQVGVAAELPDQQNSSS